MKAIDLTGKKFGQLTVIRLMSRGPTTWLCKCACGEVSVVHAGNLRAGRTKSCGCLRGEAYGLSKHPLYLSWKAMRRRCSPKCSPHQIHRYYGRGIRVCNAWMTNFMAFFTWAKINNWESGLEIDRRNNDGNYCPKNCRFVARIVNCANKEKLKNNTSGYTGISWDKYAETWVAYLNANGQRQHLGNFETKELAVAARNKFIKGNNLPHPIQEII